MSRVVVIGGGMGGLAVAARLARAKHDVVLLERAPHVGGMLASTSADGFRWDSGPTVLTIPQSLRDLFRKTGKPLERVLELTPIEPLAHYRFADGSEVELPATGPVDIEHRLQDALGGSAGEDWTRLMHRASATWEATRRDFVEAPLDTGVAAMLRMGWHTRRDLRTVAPLTSLRAIGRDYLHDARLRQILEHHATHLGSDPRRAAATLACLPYIEQTSGAWYVPGGLHRIAEVTAQRALDCGATVRLGEEQTELRTEGGRVTGVRLASGEVLAADIVVSGIDAALLYTKLLPKRRLASRIRRTTASYSHFTLLLGLSGRTPGLRHRTVLFPADADHELDALREGRRVDDPTIVINAPDDPALRPNADSESWCVQVTAPRQGQLDWDAPGAADAYAEQLLTQLAARGLPINDRITVRRTRTPADIERDSGAPGGASYGMASRGLRSAFLRPANRSPVPGLFLVGGSAHPGGGLPLVTLSAAIVAEQIGRA